MNVNLTPIEEVYLKLLLEKSADFADSMVVYKKASSNDLVAYREMRDAYWSVLTKMRLAKDAGL